MCKPWRLPVIALAVLLLGGLARKVMTPREPTYEGKPLSFWLQGYDPINSSYNSPEWLKANTAVRKTGTNAIPTLLQMLRATDSRWQLKLYLLSLQQDLIKYKYGFTSSRHHEAAQAFNILGADAYSAVPQLVEIYDSAISPSSQSSTAYALGEIGPAAKAALPSLMRGATNTIPDVRASAITALGQIHPDPFLVIPIFLKARRDSNKSVKDAASWSIDTYEKETMRSVGALFESLQDADEKVRRQATNSLKEIYPEASAKAGIR
jgi:hypothetical protein